MPLPLQFKLPHGSHACLLALLAVGGCSSFDEPPGDNIDIFVVRAQLDTIYVGDTVLVEAEAADSAGTGVGDFVTTWSSADTAILGIIPENDFRVRVAGRRTGTAVVRGETAGHSDTALVVVRERVATVAIQPRPISVTIGDTVQFAAILQDTAGLLLTGRPVLWRASAAENQWIELDENGRMIVTSGGSTFLWADSEAARDSVEIALLTDGPLGELAVGEDFGCSISSQQTAYCWGWNGWGELGIGLVQEGVWPIRLAAGGGPFTVITARNQSACGLTPAGIASCWGSNPAGQLGSPADVQSCFPGPCRGTPAPVNGAPALTSVSMGGGHACGLTSGGAAYCWGGNHAGQLGTGSSDTDLHEAVAVTGGHAFTTIAAGHLHTCALDGAGAAWCWGENARGELGLASTDVLGHPTPEAVSGGLQFQAIAAAGYYTCGLTTAGALHCWGANEFGQLARGSGDAGSYPSPAPATGGLTFKAVSTGDRHACAITTAGAAHCWGENDHGQLGVAGVAQTCTFFSFTYPCSGTPVPVSGGLQFDRIRVGTYTTCGSATDGIVYCWGANGVGQLGDRTFAGKSSPTRVAGQP